MRQGTYRITGILMAVAALGLGACGEGAGSEPLRRIEALEARVDRLERAASFNSASAGIVTADSTNSAPHP